MVYEGHDETEYVIAIPLMDIVINISSYIDNDLIKQKNITTTPISILALWGNYINYNISSYVIELHRIDDSDFLRKNNFPPNIREIILYKN